RSRAQADERLERANEEARSIVEQAERRLREMEADIDAVWRERARLIDEVRALADALHGIADEAAARESATGPVRRDELPGEASAASPAGAAGADPAGGEPPPPAAEAPEAD